MINSDLYLIDHINNFLFRLSGRMWPPTCNELKHASYIYSVRDIHLTFFHTRHRARIRGLFSAVTRPVAVGPILTQGGFQEKLFHCKCSCSSLPARCLLTLFLMKKNIFFFRTTAVLHELISSGELAGSLHGHLDKAVYIPDVYTKMQNRWTDSFLSSSGYLGRY